MKRRNRYLLRQNIIYFIAYKKFYANNGAATEGVNDDTADGFSEDKVNRLIEMLKDESHNFSDYDCLRAAIERYIYFYNTKIIEEVNG